MRPKGFVKRELGRRARRALENARAARPMQTSDGPRKGEHELLSSGHERSMWIGYHLAYAEMATGARPFADTMATTERSVQ